MMRTAATWRELGAVGLLAWTLSMAWTVANGRDINWDFLNYHLYAGFAADASRIHQDYFPASVQSYMLGYVYVPLSLVIRAGWDAWAVQLLLAAQSVPTVVAAWLVAGRLLPPAGASALAWRVVAVAAACSSPMFIAEVGTSFADVPTAALALLALYAALPGAGVGQPSRPALAGALAGAACALKLTNVPMVAGIALVCWFFAPRQARLAAVMKFAGAAAILFTALYAYWGWQLYERFGHPFFPLLLNEWFASPEYAQASVVLKRFQPKTVTEFLLRPLYMLDPVANLYTETRAPDARYLALALLAAVYAALRWGRQLAAHRCLDGMLAWTAVTWVLWLVSSGNGRYAIALAMVAGMLCVALVRQMWDLRTGWVQGIKAAVLCLVAVQALALSLSTTFRWDGRDSPDQAYFAPDVPAALVHQPHVIVTFQTQSVSWLAPFVHARSVFISPAGQYLISPESAAGARVAALLDAGLPVVVAIPATQDSSQAERAVRSQEPLASLFGLRIDASDCHAVVMGRVLRPPGETAERAVTTQGYQLCRAHRALPLAAQALERARRIDPVLDQMEDWCPGLFQPPRMQTVCSTESCMRRYINTDVSLVSYRSGVVVALGFGSAQPGVLATLDEIQAGKVPRCPSVINPYSPFSAGETVMAKPR